MENAALKQPFDSRCTDQIAAEDLPPPLPVGAVLNERYRLSALLAVGGTSHVYRAEDLLAGAIRNSRVEVAVKVHHTVRVDERDIAPQMALEELFTARRLCHENIVRIYDFNWDAPVCFVTMEYVPGESLAQRLARSANGRLPAAEALKIVEEVAGALEAAHRQDIVHSDLKPANILLAEDGGIKVIDFASARASSPADPQHPGAEPGYIGYSPRYASLQVLQDEPPRPSDDVYSLACVLYHMHAGLPPFGEYDALEACRLGLSVPRPADMPPLQWRVLKKGLTTDHRRRFDSATEFVRAFARAAHGSRRIALAAAAGVLMSIGAALAGVTGYQHLTEHRRLAAFEASASQGAALVEKIAGTEVLRRPALLDQAAPLPGPLNGAVRAEAQPLIGPALLDAVEQQLARSADAARLDALQAPVEEALLHYPDSASLNQALERISRERYQLVSSLTLAFQQTWTATEFTAQEAEELAATLDQLEELGVEAEAVADAPTVQRYAEVLRQAREAIDVSTLDRLARFQETLPQVPALQSALQTLESADLRAARRLAAFDPSQDPTHYPAEAADHFWGERFATLNARIPSLWGNTDLNSTKQTLDQLGEQVFAGYEPFQRARRNLAERFIAKAEYYEKRGNRRSAAWLRRQAKDLDVY